MIIDANAWLGHWPFRQLRHNDVSGLLKLMDANAIDVAVVSSIHGIFYKNCQRANEELAAETQNHRDRLVPLATLNPNYPGWERNLRICHEDFDMRGLRLFPAYHDYDLADTPALELIAAATELGMPVSLPQRVVDVRQRHWMDTERNLTLPEFEALARACPDTTFIILNALGLQEASFMGQSDGRSIVADISRMTAVMHNDIGAMLDNFGSSSLVFGTGIPFKYPKPALLKMEILEASEADKEQIWSGNMRRILRMA